MAQQMLEDLEGRILELVTDITDDLMEILHLHFSRRLSLRPSAEELEAKNILHSEYCFFYLFQTY